MHRVLSCITLALQAVQAAQITYETYLLAYLAIEHSHADVHTEA